VRRAHLLAAGILQRRVQRKAADLVGGEQGAGQHRDDAGGCLRFARVDTGDASMRVRRADEHQVKVAGLAEVVDIAALPVSRRSSSRG